MARWREIHGYEGRYIVSDEGDIYSLPKNVATYGGREGIRRGQYLTPGIRGSNGLMYKAVYLSDGKGNTKYVSVHRIVAEAFCENPHNYEVVNHIDHNTLNNRADNLEWCDQQYNNEYSHNKAVRQFTMDGECIAEYKSATYASKITGIGRRSIANALNGWSETAGGYRWDYSED